jgi:hypothetical protein
MFRDRLYAQSQICLVKILGQIFTWEVFYVFHTLIAILTSYTIFPCTGLHTAMCHNVNTVLESVEAQKMIFNI